jgi:hypothetical protein
MNKYSQHTPGPWWIDDNGFVASGSGDDYKTIADPRCMEPRGNEAEIDANADLIAAAPDLLVELKGLLEVFTAYIDTEDVANADIVEAVRAAAAAIAAAEGRGKPSA